MLYEVITTSSDVWYRIYLKTTNSIGISRIIVSDVIPNISTITLDSEPSGLSVKLDGQPKSTPTTVQSVVGMQRELQSIFLQNLNGVIYQFDSWSDGGDATHFISVPSVDTTYTVHNVALPYAPISFRNNFV